MSISDELLWLKDHGEFKFCTLQQKSKIPSVKGWQNEDLNFDDVINKHLLHGTKCRSNTLELKQAFWTLIVTVKKLVLSQITT